jgi:hypothetical protein
MFAVWNDANSNGVVDGGELHSLAEAGITSISLVSDGQSYSAANGDVSVAGSATYTRVDGTTGTVADAMFARSSAAKSAAQEVDRVAANSNSIALAAAVAAAGVVASSAAAAKSTTAVQDDISVISSASHAGITDIGIADAGARFSAQGALYDGGFDFGAMSMASTSHTAIAATHIGELSTSLSLGSGPNALLDATDFGAMLQMPAMATGMNVAMPSFESLMPQAAGVSAQGAGVIEQILADALQGGGSGPDINALLNALPGGSGLGEIAGLHGLATPVMDGVQGWDTGHGGVFTFDAASIITSEAMVLHHDAVQPVSNG